MQRAEYRPRAIFFDLYETLITEFEPNFTPQPTLADALRVDKQRFVDEWRKLQKRKMEGKFSSFPHVLEEICEKLGVCPPPQPILQQLLQERVAAKAKPFLQIDADVLQLLIRLRDTNNIKLGLISNASDEEVGAWTTSPLAPFFNDVIFSYEVGIAKPDKQIYDLACARLGVSPDTCLFVGDGTSDELVGANEAGMKPLWAVWFLNRWPAWKMPPELRQKNAQFPALESPLELVSLISFEG